MDRRRTGRRYPAKRDRRSFWEDGDVHVRSGVLLVVRFGSAGNRTEWLAGNDQRTASGERRGAAFLPAIQSLGGRAGRIERGSNAGNTVRNNRGQPRGHQQRWTGGQFGRCRDYQSNSRIAPESERMHRRSER